MAAPSRSHVPPLLVLTVALAGCGGTRSTVGDGMFQKRHLRPGWHVDLGGRDPIPNKERLASRSRMEPRSCPYPKLAGPAPIPRIEPAEHNPTASTEPLALSATELSSFPRIGQDNRTFAPDTTRTALRQLIEEPARRWNPWALPAFVAAAGTVVLALATGTSSILVVLGVVVTLILAAIALRKGRKNEWSGKGFAVAAMMIGSLAALITLIALISGGA